MMSLSFYKQSDSHQVLIDHLFAWFWVHIYKYINLIIIITLSLGLYGI